MDSHILRGTPQRRCYFWLLLVVGVSFFALGALLFIIDGLCTVGIARSPFSSSLHAWWRLGGFAVGPDLWLGFMLMAFGAMCMAASEYRVVLNVLTVLSLLAAAYFTMINASAILISSGQFTEDIRILWDHADTLAVCRFQAQMACSGLLAVCPMDFPLPGNPVPATLKHPPSPPPLRRYQTTREGAGGGGGGSNSRAPGSGGAGAGNATTAPLAQVRELRQPVWTTTTTTTAHPTFASLALFRRGRAASAAAEGYAGEYPYAYEHPYPTGDRRYPTAGQDVAALQPAAGDAVGVDYDYSLNRLGEPAVSAGVGHTVEGAAGDAADGMLYHHRRARKLTIGAHECRNCSQHNPYGWDRDINTTCLGIVESEAASVVAPFAAALALIFGGLALMCVLCAQALGMAFALTTVMLVVMMYAFSAWKALFRPDTADVVEWQRGVAIAANFIAMQLATVSIAGLHWKPQLPTQLKKNITFVLFIVPVFGIASSFALLLPSTEEFFGLVREVYCTVLLVVLVRIWDDTARTVPVISIGAASHAAAESIRATQRWRVNILCLVKVVAIDINAYFLGEWYPPIVKNLLLWLGVVLFSVILVIIHEIFKYLPSLRDTGELQFFSIKAIVSFIFFDFAVLKVLNYEGFQSVMVGELYVSVALVGLAVFQLYTWLVAPLNVAVHASDSPLLSSHGSRATSERSPSGPAGGGPTGGSSGYGTMDMRVGEPMSVTIGMGGATASSRPPKANPYRSVLRDYR